MTESSLSTLVIVVLIAAIIVGVFAVVAITTDEEPFDNEELSEYLAR